MTTYRLEKDSLGNIQVPTHVYWGAQTERSRHNFTIGNEEMPKELILAIVLIKKAASIVNCEFTILSQKKKKIICQVCDEILAGELLDQFPLVIWQTGSGTQTNMNVNEVIANRAIELLKGKLGSKTPVHPNDDVNMSQSTNDVFPSAIHIASCIKIQEKLLPALKRLLKALNAKTKEFHTLIKVGRTHLMDAAPLTLGQEFSGYATLVEHGIQALEIGLQGLYELALGGTAVGTGMNAPKGFSKRICEVLSELTDLPFKPAKNKFEALSCHDAILGASGTLKRLACSLYKIANDIRWMASGPRSGLGEIQLPENEPGSSIMPGKINPTQCEAMTMVCIQVMGYDAAISFAGALGNFELNVYKPLVAYNFLHSIELLSDASDSFTTRCVTGIKPNLKRIHEDLHNSLMLATALTPLVGYDKTAEIVKKAHAEHKSLKECAVALGHLTAKEFDKALNLKKMVFPDDL